MCAAFVSLFQKVVFSFVALNPGQRGKRLQESDFTNRSKSNSEHSPTTCKQLHENFNQKIVCDLRIANEMEMGLKYCC